MDPQTLASTGGVVGNLFFKDKIAQRKADGFKNQTIEAEDFTIKTHPKDTLVMAGGTKFGDETNTLLRQLIETIEKGSEVVLNGDKVGQALALGSSKMR